jgi:hypothetical protein
MMLLPIQLHLLPRFLGSRFYFHTRKLKSTCRIFEDISLCPGRWTCPGSTWTSLKDAAQKDKNFFGRESLVIRYSIKDECPLPTQCETIPFIRPIFFNRLRHRFIVNSYNYQLDSKLTNTPTNFDQLAFLFSTASKL